MSERGPDGISGIVPIFRRSHHNPQRLNPEVRVVTERPKVRCQVHPFQLRRVPFVRFFRLKLDDLPTLPGEEFPELACAHAVLVVQRRVPEAPHAV